MPEPKLAVTGNAPEKVASSAPPLPAAVAKQYGLHDHDHDDHQAKKGTVVPDKNALLEDVQTDMAIEDIQAEESDALLAAEDSAQHPALSPAKKGFRHSIGRFFAAWWRNKWARWTTIIILTAGITAVTVIPQSRYYVLNTVGVRSSASVIVVDNATELPLRNVTVTIGGQTVKTDKKGIARLTNLELGPAKLHIQRIAFAAYDIAITIGWGSNPLGSYKLQATGVQYVVLVTDYLSGKPIAGAEATSDDAQALSDKDGKITLTVQDTDAVTLPVTISDSSYRAESLVLNAEDETPTKVILVPAQKHVFVSDFSGKKDVYATDIDGKNSKLLLAGTGTEINNISLSADATGEQAALVSTRDNVRDKDGFLMNTLTLINTRDNSIVTVDHGVQIQLIGWAGPRLIYRITMPGASAANAQRYRIITYNYETNARLQLTSANQFTVSQVTRDYLYYAASSNDPKAVIGLFRIKPDGTSKQKVFDREVWTAVRTSYDTFALQTPDSWFNYAIGSATASDGSAPGSLDNKLFVNNSNDTRSISIGQKDGRATIDVYDLQKNRSKTLTDQDGLADPIRWAGDKAIIYRVATGGESADYAISPAGGVPHKIADVVVSYGIASE